MIPQNAEHSPAARTKSLAPRSFQTCGGLRQERRCALLLVVLGPHEVRRAKRLGVPIVPDKMVMGFPDNQIGTPDAVEDMVLQDLLAGE